ncbi:hypothetical protein [Bradyrhizobium centrosematis]|uniref:hypothetical protein n=1 Tax=Bradyrhizobium centrosematis TaxID=1300039 RepID=UPI00388F5FFE
MTSISAASAGNYQSPLQRLQQELQSEVSAGTISSSDQSALSTALTDIDTALQQSQSSGTRPSKEGMQSKIDDLISSEVSNGTLTSDQADELKSVFQSALANGPGGAGGPPSGPPPDDSSSDASSTDSTSSSSTDQTTAEILQQFLQALQQSQSSSSSYGANGSSSSSSNFSALLIDYKS